MDQAGSSLLADLEIDFDRIQSDFLFPDLMDFDALGCGNVTSLVSSDDILGDLVRPDDSSSQGNLDLNRPFTSYHNHDEDWLRDFSS